MIDIFGIIVGTTTIGGGAFILGYGFGQIWYTAFYLK